MSTETTSIEDNTTIFQELEKYPWDQDKEFQGGLSAILGTTTSEDQTRELTLRAQCFYFSRKKSIPIDFDAYKTYLLAKPSSSSQSQSTTSPSPSTPQQQQAPTMSQTSTPTASPPNLAPYPPTFNEIVALITAGAPIPGIIEIPNTIISDKATKPVEKKRRKPWEKDISEEAVQGAGAMVDGKKIEGTFGDRRDEVIVQEFPEGV